MMLAEDLLPGAKAAAAFMGLPVRAVYHLAETGQVPVIRKSGKLYFRRSELERSFSTEGGTEQAQ